MDCSKQQELVKLELKYCEVCGGLWLRPEGTEVLYCDPCQPLVAELALPGGHRPGQPPAQARRRP